jgi:hypothetical protein
MTVFRVSNSVLMPLGYASLGGNKMALFARIVKSAEGMEVNIKVGAGTLFLAAVGVAAVCTKVGPMTMQIARDPESRRELLQWVSRPKTNSLTQFTTKPQDKRSTAP